MEDNIRCGKAVMTRSEDNGRVSSLLAPLVPGDQTQVTRLSDTHLYLHVWLCAMRMSGTQEGQKKASDTLKLEEMAISHPVGSGNLTQLLCWNN